MATEFLADPGKFAVLLNNIHHASHGKMASLVVEKHLLVCRVWPGCKIGSECLGRFLLKVDGSLLVSLAVHQHRACLKGNIRNSQPNQFCYADAGLEEELQDRVV